MKPRFQTLLPFFFQIRQLVPLRGGGETTELLFSLLLVQAGVGGSVKIHSVAAAAPLTIADEVVTAVTTYPGAPAVGRMQVELS